MTYGNGSSRQKDHCCDSNLKKKKNHLVINIFNLLRALCLASREKERSQNSHSFHSNAVLFHLFCYFVGS